MIVGNGLLAQAFYKSFGGNEYITIFASGVSNSQELSAKNFLREELLLKQELNKKKKIIYFSTCSVSDPTLLNSPYVLHKIRMEKIIALNSMDYLIFRLPQIVGRTENPNTLTNFIYDNIKNSRKFKVYEAAKRNIIDVEHVAAIAELAIEIGYSCCTINVANSKSISVLKIVQLFEEMLSITAVYDLLPGGSSYDIDVALCYELAKRINLVFDANYVESTIKKYYA